MMYKILSGTTVVNTIEAELGFVEQYSCDNGYTYEAVPPTPPVAALPTEVEQLRADVDCLTLALADMLGGGV